MNAQEIKDKPIKDLLRVLNQNNYKNVTNPLVDNCRISDVERVLYQIEFKLFGNIEIQTECFEAIKPSLKNHYKHLIDGLKIDKDLTLSLIRVIESWK